MNMKQALQTRTFLPGVAESPATAAVGNAAQLALHLAQKMRPQFRQWCRRRRKVNGPLHAMHTSVSLSASQRTPRKD